MIYRELDKEALKKNAYTVLSKITLLNDNSVFTEDDFIVDWNYEDYRYVPDVGFIGQFVERILDGNLQNIPDDKIFENQEINLQIGIVNGIDEMTTWYDYGNFLITKVEKEDTSGNYKFESADYTKKFNKEYVDTLNYPCLALELANNVCGQVDITMDTKSNADYYIVGEEGLSAGDYAFKVGTTYYKFTTTSDLVKNDVLMLIEYYNRLYVKTVRYDEETGYTVTRTFLTFTTGDTVGDYSLLATRSTGYVDFTNNDFVIENNQYEEQDTCRKVMQDIGKLAYSWVRIGTDNKLYIDFNQMSQASVDDYDKLTTNEYYVSKKQDLYYGPVNKVVLGMSNIEGESLYRTSSTYTEDTECAIRIFDNNLTYTDELRAIALNGCERLFGLEYMPLQIETIGHPWLEGNELIKLTNVDEEELYTYPFNRAIKYAGYIKGSIGAEASTSQNTEYEYDSEIVNQINKTSIIVDKNNQTITSLVSDMSDAQSNITTLQQTTDSLTATVEHLDEEYEQNVVVRRDAEGNPIEVEDAGNYELEDFKIYGGTSQDGEPTPSNPVDIDTVTSKTTTVDYSGSSIDIDYSYDQGLVKVEESAKEFEGNTYQEQTSGYNLLPINEADNVTWANGIAMDSCVSTLNSLPNGTYRFIAKFKLTTTTGSFQATDRYGVYLANSGVSNVLNSRSSWNTSTIGTIKSLSVAFTINETSRGRFTKFYLYGCGNDSVGGTGYADIYDMQISLGSEERDFQPYTNGPTPNPQYPQPIQVVTGNQEIEVVGKNLFDFNDFIQNNIIPRGITRGTATYTDNSITITATSNDAYTFYSFTSYGGIPPIIKVEKNTDYTLSWETDTTGTTAKGLVYIFGKTSNGSIAVITNQTDINKSKTFNTGDYEYITFRVGVSASGQSITYSNIMLEKGSTVTEYEPYISNKYEINLGKNLFDNTITRKQYSGCSDSVIETGKRITASTSGTGYLYSCYVITNLTNYVGKTIRLKCNYVASASNTANYTIGICASDGSNRTAKMGTGTSGNTISYYVDGITQGKEYLYVILYANAGGTVAVGDYIDYTNIILTINDEDMTYTPYLTPIELCKIGDYKDNLIKVKLPDGYTQVEYIESTGTQWLDTGYTPTEKTKMQFRFRNIEKTGDVILGFFKTQDNQDYRFFNYNNQIYWDIGSSRIYDGECLSNTDYYFEFGNYYVRDLITNNTLISNSTAVGSFTGNSTIKINYYEREGYEKVSKNRVYLLKVYEDNVLVRDYLPCYRNSDGKTGLYDLANNTFITNQGTGEFEIGNSVESKWYLYKQIGQVVLDGRHPVYNPGASGQENLYYIFASSLDINYLRGGWCNNFKYVHSDNITANNGANQILQDNQMCFRMGTTKDRLYIKTSLYTSAPNDLKTWFSTHPTNLYYVMQIPTYTEITNEELISQLETLNNCEFYSNITHYTTTSSNLPLISNFSISDLPYKVITISDEDDNTYAFKPLFRNLELCKIGDYIDYLYRKDGKWYKHSEIGKLVFDGSESGWTAYKQDNNIYSYYKNIPTAKTNYTGAYNVYNYFKWASGLSALNSGYASIGGATATKNGNFIFCVGDTTNELASFKTWLSTHNTEVYYLLETPTETEITDEEIIPELNRLMLHPLYKGYNKIYLNDELCDKLSIRYLTDSMFNDTYATKSQLSMTNNSITALVQKSDSLESNLAQLDIRVDGITNTVSSVQNVTADLENSINYLAIDMSGNSLIIPTSDENKPYVSTTYQIPYNATFKGETVAPTVTTTSPSVTGITLSFTTGFINVAVTSTTAISTTSNSFALYFTYVDNEKTYVVNKTLNVTLSVQGKDGEDGTSVTILGSYNTLSDLQAAHPTGNAGDSYMVGTDLYVWDVSSSSWKDVGQIKGTDGISTYFYVRYSENADGNPMTASPTSSSKYIGVCSTISNTAPTAYTSYTWSKYRGENGDTTYLHVKYSEDGSTFVPASDDAAEGDTPSAWVGVLTDTNPTASTTFSDYTWYKFTEDIDGQLVDLQNQISKNASDIDNNYKGIIEKLNDYAKNNDVIELKRKVETNQTDTDYAIRLVSDLQVNGVSQVRTEKGFTFNDDGMTIDATNSVTKSVTDTNGIKVIDKSGSANSELMFAGYDETTKTSIVRTENLSVTTYFNIGSKSRFEDYKTGTGVFI